MCIFTVFHFVCGASKLKVATPCSNFATNVQGIGFCRDDPVAHLDDGHNDSRAFVTDTFSPGICSNVRCRQLFHLIPPHEYHLCDAKNLIEDDEPFDMSDQACAEREDRWYRQMLSTDQQLQLLDTSYPLSEDLVSPYNKYVLKDMATAGKYGHMEVNPDDLGWQELNPRYLSDFGLWVSTTSILPASVTDTRYHEHQTSSPFQPAFGPFKVRSHFCKPKKGICKTCGRYNITKSGRNEQYHERKGVTAQATTSSTRTDLDWPHSKLFGCYGATVDQGEHQPRGDCDEQGDSFMSEN